ncbi:DUF4811 domain-containing protein [Lactococcus muris]|uniref:DUF4811 domain-containing protein n=1 Tax=Lactococcus muris TaxID=2941330 RepID=A0ABV4D932_9LACT
MIIIFIILFALSTFFGFMYINKEVWRAFVGGLSLLLLTISVMLLTLHIKDNWGMEKRTSTETKIIYTAGPLDVGFGMLLKSEIGKATHNYALVYRTDEKDKEPVSHFQPDEKHLVETLKKTADYKRTEDSEAKLVIRTVKWQFKNSFMRLLFGIGNEEGKLVSEHARAYVPKDTWLVLTQEEAKKLQAAAPAMRAKFEAFLKANPIQAREVMELQKSNPEEFAKLQVSQIKEQLGFKE